MAISNVWSETQHDLQPQHSLSSQRITESHQVHRQQVQSQNICPSIYNEKETSQVTILMPFGQQHLLLCTCYMGNLSRLGYRSSFKMIWKLAVLRMVCRSLTSGQVSLTHPSPFYPHISPLEWKSLFSGQGAPAPLNIWRDKLGISLCSSIFLFFFFLTEEQPLFQVRFSF